MDGFVRAHRAAECDRPNNAICGRVPEDVMGYHTKHVDTIFKRVFGTA